MANSPEHFKIPRAFTLFGHKYRIEIVPDLFNSDDAYGDEDEDLKRIRIQASGPMKKRYTEKNKEVVVNFKITKETTIETFYHEVTHAILESIGETELSSNEKFVNMFSKALLEIYLTSDYEEKKSKK